MASVANSDDSFYKDSVAIIMDWLGEQEKFDFLREFQSGDAYFETLPDLEKLMALLRFIEANYVQLPNRIAAVYLHLEKVNQLIDGAKIKDVDIPDIFGGYERLSTLKQQLSKEENALPSLFEEFLKAVGLQEAYREYRMGLKEERRERRD
jgi:hypothetical protein